MAPIRTVFCVPIMLASVIAAVAQAPGGASTGRVTSAARSADQMALVTVALDDRKEWVVRKAAIDQITDPAMLARVAGDMGSMHIDWCQALARVRLALVDPVIRTRFPNAEVEMSYNRLDQQYFGEAGNLSATGEEIGITLRQGSEILASGTWKPNFPSEIIAQESHISAKVDVSSIMRQLLSRPEFIQGDLLQLIQSRIPEVQAGALANLTVGPNVDQKVLAKVAMGDYEDTVCVAAADKLTDQALLAKVAEQVFSESVKVAAIGRLTDQNEIAKVVIAGGDNSDYVRIAAFARLTDQTVLAKIVFGNYSGVLRVWALERVTDQTILEAIVAGHKDVDGIAADKLASIRSGKP